MTPDVVALEDSRRRTQRETDRQKHEWEIFKKKLIVLGFAVVLWGLEFTSALAEKPVGKLKAWRKHPWIFPAASFVVVISGITVQIWSFCSKARAEGAKKRFGCLFFTGEVDGLRSKIWANRFDFMGILFWFAHFGLIIFDLVMKSKHKEVEILGLLSVYPGIAASIEMLHAIISLCHCFDYPYLVRSANGRRVVGQHEHYAGYDQIYVSYNLTVPGAGAGAGAGAGGAAVENV